jgi:hypothetical protein
VFDVSHWAMFVGGLALGITAGVTLGRHEAKGLYAKTLEQVEGLDERLSLIEAWIRQLATLQKMSLHREGKDGTQPTHNRPR